MTTQCDIAIIGMAVMGQNLALNIARKGFAVAVFNRTGEKTQQFITERVADEPIVPTYTLAELAGVLRKPRRIMLMVKAGQAVDEFITAILPHLEPGDLLIDGGNSFFRDTERRIALAENHQLLFLGTGVSGGEYGALHGPSIMPGGHREGYLLVQEILEKAAAQVEDGPCCAYLGPGGSGHFVKMVHNGIEYAIMQAIAEVYDLMRRLYALPTDMIQRFFEEWKESEIASYLVEITARILAVKDPHTQKPLVEVILDAAEQKGTGKWTSQVAFDLGVPTPIINQAVIARSFSFFKEIRTQLAPHHSEISPLPFTSHEAQCLKNSLLFAMVMAFSEGFALLKAASQESGYTLHLPEIARIWKGGCILRTALLSRLQRALTENAPLLFASAEFLSEVKTILPQVRETVHKAANWGIPLPVLGSALTSFDSWTSAVLPANLLQAQRDFFGAHTYRRIDQEGVFHTNWEECS